MPTTARSGEMAWFDPISSRKISNGTDLAAAQLDLFSALAEEALQRVPAAERSSVCLFEEEESLLRFVALSCAGWPDSFRKRKPEMKGVTIGAVAVKKRGPVIISDVTKDHRYQPLDSWARSLISVPLFWRSMIAVIHVESPKVAAFKRTDSSELQLLVAESAGIFEHFGLKEDRWLLDLEMFLHREERDTMPEAEPHERLVLRDFCRRVLREHVQPIFGVRACSIFLKYPFSSVLRLAASTALNSGEPDTPTYPIGKGLTGWVAENRRVLRLRDVTSRNDLSRVQPRPVRKKIWLEFPDSELEGNRTYLAAPLEVGRILVGVIRLTAKNNAVAFTSHDAARVKSIADRLARSIQIIWLQEQQAILDRLGRRLAETLEVKDAAHIILEEGLALFHCDAGHIRILDKAAQHLKKVASVGPASDKLAEVRKFGEGLAGDVALKASHRIVPDITKDPQVLQIIRTVLGLPHDGIPAWLRSEVCFPMTIGRDVIGTINLHSPHADWFGDPDAVNLLSNFTSRGALALRAATLVQSTRVALLDRERALSELRTIGVAFVNTLDLDRFLRGILRAALRQSGISSGTVRILNEKGTAWLLRAVDDNERSRGRLLPELPADIELFQQAARSPNAIWIPDTSLDSRFQAFKKQFHNTSQGAYLAAIHSMLIVPMRISERARGLIFLCPTKLHRLKDSTVKFLEILGAEAALALATQEADVLARRMRLSEPLLIMAVSLGMFLHGARNRLIGLRRILENMEPSSSREQLKEEVAKFTRALDEAALFAQSGSSTEGSDLKSVLAGVLSEYRFDEQLMCNVNLDGPSMPVKGSAVQIAGCVALILDNAIEAIRQRQSGRGTITVTTRDDGPAIVLSIKDTGVGMTDDVKARAFDLRFTTKPAGTGIGLPLVDRVIRELGGSLRIKSRNGVGTTVLLRFPKKDAYAATTGR